MESILDLLTSPVGPYIVTVAGMVLVGWGARHFPTRKEFDGLGERVTGLTTVSQNTAGIAEQALALAQRVRDEHEAQRVEVMETLREVAKDMRAVSNEMREMQKEQAKITGELGPLSRDVARLFKKLDG